MTSFSEVWSRNQSTSGQILQLLWSEVLWLLPLKSGGAALVQTYLNKQINKSQYYGKKEEAEVQLSLPLYQRKICQQHAWGEDLAHSTALNLVYVG